MKAGIYSSRSTCRFCGSQDLLLFLDMGRMPLAGDYLKKEQLGSEEYFPVKVYFCNNCFLVQLLDIIQPTKIFSDYRYLSSVSLANHFLEYAEEMVDRFLTKKSFVVEIGSNDGVLLKPLKDKGIRVLGVDPAKNVAKVAQKKTIETIQDFFSLKTAEKISNQYGKVDAIFANNVLAHIDNMEDVFFGIDLLLQKEGILVFEVHYVLELIEKLQYDFFYPGEHLSYYSLLTLSQFLDKFNMDIFDVKKIPIHAGSIRVYVKRKENRKLTITDSVKTILQNEIEKGINNFDYFKNFSSNVFKHKESLKKLLNRLVKEKKIIVGYGAAGRGNSLINFCHLNPKLVQCIYDSSPERYDRFTPQSHIPIINASKFKEARPDYTIIFAWSYKNEIMQKEKEYLTKGGQFIIPLPNIQIIKE